MNKEVCVCGIVITNPQKEMFSKITKLDLVKYYNKVANKMLPYIKNRLLTFISCPQGVNKQCFIQKHLRNDIKGVFEYKAKNSDGTIVSYYYINDKKGLISLIQNNVIEIHMSGSRIEKVDNPDYMIFDLDPDKDIKIEKLHLAVRLVYEVLKQLKFKVILKTSGKKGYHLLAKLDGSKSFEEVKELSFNIATLLQEKYSSIFTTNILKNKRKGKIFIDYLRNSKKATTVAPYSIRINKKPTISKIIPYSKLSNSRPDMYTILD